MKMEFCLNRRRFFKQAALFGGFFLVLAAGKPAAAKPAATAPPRKPEMSGQGYRLTDHVKKYYETARS